MFVWLWGFVGLQTAKLLPISFRKYRVLCTEVKLSVTVI